MDVDKIPNKFTKPSNIIKSKAPHKAGLLKIAFDAKRA